MNWTTPQPARPSLGTITVTLLAGLLVLLILFRAGGADTQPPECYSYLFYPVPCDPWVAPLAGALTAGIVGFGLWRFERRRR